VHRIDGPATFASSALVVALGSTGCATALSSFQPAHVAPKGHFQTEIGVDVSVSTGAIHKVVDAAEAIDEAANRRDLTDEEKLTIMQGGAHLALNPPALVPHAGIAYAPWDGWEFALRFAASGWRIGARRQLLDQDSNGVDLSVGVGGGRAAFTPPVEDVLDRLHIDDFARWNLDATVAIGQHGLWYRWWAGPHLVYSRMSESMTLSIPFARTQVSGSVSGRALFAGGYAGAAFGYRSVFIGPELSFAWLLGDADVTALGTTTNVDVGSFILYPAFAVMGEF
jgi:hypothetical protein